MRSDPWKQMSRPKLAKFSGRRADADHPYDFFWARDLQGRCLLVFEYPSEIRIRDRRPRLKQIRIIEPHLEGEPARFILELMQDENREIFHQLCLDIIESTRACVNQKSALATLIRRTWRWHGMLKGGQDERLSPELQKGLIGELRVLELALLPRFTASEAFDFWHGPEDSPKDFYVGNIAIEAKAKRGAAQPHVQISSEHQLDDGGVSDLFLAVTYVNDAAPEMQGALTISDYIDHIAQIAKANDAGSLSYFEGRLTEAGYSHEHDYSDQHWLVGDTRWFNVSGNFPRLITSALSNGLRKVVYSLDLVACDEWETDLANVESAMDGDGA